MTIAVPQSAQAGRTVTLTGHASWLVCAEVCVPEDSDVTLVLPAALKPSASCGMSLAPRVSLPLRLRVWAWAVASRAAAVNSVVMDLMVVWDDTGAAVARARRIDGG